MRDTSAQKSHCAFFIVLYGGSPHQTYYIVYGLMSDRSPCILQGFPIHGFTLCIGHFLGDGPLIKNMLFASHISLILDLIDAYPHGLQVWYNFGKYHSTLLLFHMMS